MIYAFRAYGHENITAKHRTTLEFTKDKELSRRGTCIAGVRADFSISQLKKFIKSLKNNKIRIIIEIDIKRTVKCPLIKNQLLLKNKKTHTKRLKEVIHAEINPEFNSENEMVVRKSDFKDGRTFALRADKASLDLSRELVAHLGNAEQEIRVAIEGLGA
jgi:hypothetical protein